jgi:hypothetical protein
MLQWELEHNTKVFLNGKVFPVHSSSIPHGAPIPHLLPKANSEISIEWKAAFFLAKHHQMVSQKLIL